MGKDRKRTITGMHELGILRNVVGIVEQAAEKNNIAAIKSITLEVGEASEAVPVYLEKLFPAVTDGHPILKNAELIIQTAGGKSLIIKEIRY